MSSYPQSFEYPFTIRCVAASEDALFVGTFRSSYVNEPDNCARRLDKNFREIWKFPLKYDPLQIASALNYVIILTHNFFPGNGILYCLDQSSGLCVWKKNVSGLSVSSELCILEDDVLLFGESEIVKYSIKKGERLCSANHINYLNSAKISNGSIISSSRTSLAKFRSDDLTQEWIVEGLYEPWGFGCDVEHAYVSKDQKLAAYDLKTGVPSGQVEMNAILAILGDGDHLYFHSEHDNNEKYVVSCYSKVAKRPVWHSEVPISIGNVNYTPRPEFLTEKAVVFRANEGPVYALDKTTGDVSLLLSESNMPNNRFPTANSPPLFAFQGWIFIQYGKTIYMIAEFPSSALGSKILDAEKVSWMQLQN